MAAETRSATLATGNEQDLRWKGSRLVHAAQAYGVGLFTDQGFMKSVQRAKGEIRSILAGQVPNGTGLGVWAKGREGVTMAGNAGRSHGSGSEARKAQIRKWSGSWRRPEPLVMVALAASAGVVLDRYAVVPWTAWLVVGCAAVALWWLLGWFAFPKTRALILLIGVATAGGAWHHLAWHRFRHDDLGFLANREPQPVCVEAEVRTHPACFPAPPPDPLRTRPAGARTELVVRARRARDGQQWRVVSGEVQVQIDGWRNDLATGDLVQIWGLLQAPAPQRNPGEASQAAVERAHRRLCQLQVQDAAAIQVLVPANGYQLRAWMRHLRAHCEQHLSRHLAPRQAALASALLLGTRSGLDRELTDQFFQTGTVHLLAISGLHLGILVGGFWSLARFLPLPRRASLLLILALVTFYTLLTEAKPPVVRAAVIVSTLCIGRLCERTPLSFNTLALAWLVILAMQPTQAFQIGTQLSFLAVAVLLARSRLPKDDDPPDALEKLLQDQESVLLKSCRMIGRNMLEVTRASAAITGVTLPLVLGQFHLFSPIGLLVNPLVWAPVSLALFSGLGVLFLADGVSLGAGVCGWFCQLNLMVLEACIRFSQQIPGSHVWWVAPPWWWIAAFYVGWFQSVYQEPVSREETGYRGQWTWRACGLLWIALGVFLAIRSLSPWLEPPAKTLRCTFVSVGHGTCVLLEFPTGQNLLYDAGRLGEPATGVRAISSVLWSRGITHLDAIVISHADADHYNAVPGLLKRFSVAEVHVSPWMFDEPSEALDTLHAAINAAHIPLRTVQAGDRWQWSDETTVDVLHPQSDRSSGGDNADSIVLRIRHAGQTLLLPGDLEADGLARLLAQAPHASAVVMAPHHGSLHSQPHSFLAWSQPRHVIVSGARSPQVGLMRQAYSAGGAHFWHTSYDGAITVCLEPSGIRVTDFQHRRCQQMARAAHVMQDTDKPIKWSEVTDFQHRRCQQMARAAHVMQDSDKPIKWSEIR